MRTGRRLCRVIVADPDPDGLTPRSVITYRDIHRARLQARTIAEFGGRAEIHTPDEHGLYSCLEVHEPG
jgi:hypothetical protein